MGYDTYAFNNQNPDATVVRKATPHMVIEKPRAVNHIHSYGGESPFFRDGLPQGKLLGTKCANKNCPNGQSGLAMLPPRVYCMDCLEKAEWVDLTNNKAKVHTHVRVHRSGAFNRLPMPADMISVEIEGVSTILMSYFISKDGGQPKIGQAVRPKFKTEQPTFTIIDLHWAPA